MNVIGLGSIAGIPIGITPWFLVLVAWIFLPSVGAFGGDYGAFILAERLAWFLTITVSLLVHEFGHALVAKRFRLHPSVYLHIFGGLCAHDDASSDGEEARVLIAGPAAGLLLGGAAFGVQQVVGQPVGIGRAFELGIDPGSYFVRQWVSTMVWFNLFWNVVNLLPIWPLDGGRLTRLGLLRRMRGAQAEKILHSVSIGLLFVGGIYVGGRFGLLGILLAGWLIWENVKVLRGDASSGRVRSQGRFSRELLTRAREAFAAEEYREAARLCHQIRAESTVPAAVLDEVWSLLGRATNAQGDPKQAASYLKRARLTPELADELLDCLHRSEQWRELDAVIQGRDFARLSAATREALVAKYAS